MNIFILELLWTVLDSHHHGQPHDDGNTNYFLQRMCNSLRLKPPSFDRS